MADKIKDDNCPHCGEDLIENGIGFAQEGIQEYNTYVQKRKDPITKKTIFVLEFEMDEFVEGDGGHFYCVACGEDLAITEEEVKNILKKGVLNG